MQVDTRFGRVEVDPDTVLTFPGGLPGFEEFKRFKLFHEKEQATVYILQSLDDPELQFPLADPGNFRVGYQITLSDAEITLLDARDTSGLLILVILSRPQQGPDASIHANFLAPLIIEPQTRIGLQKTLNQVEGFVTIVAD